MITIVDYKPKYRADFESLNRVWIEKYFKMEQRDEYVLTNPDQAIIQKGGSILVALYNDVVAGVVALIKVNDDTYEFAKMGVDENFRRRGIAEALSYSAFEKAELMGASNIILFSNTALEPALQLYRKLGFKEVPLDRSSEYSRSNIKMQLDLRKIHPGK